MRFRTKGQAALRPAVLEDAELRPTHPPLIVLAPDASSICALRLLAFADNECVLEYLRFWYPGESATRLTAFWALPAPAESEATEAVILVRHARDRQLVYAASFSTMDEALAAVRTEIGKGLRLRDVSLYYAAPVSIEVTPAGVLQLLPPTPPAFERPVCRRGEAQPATQHHGRPFEAMRVRRFQPHAAPFGGFGSPPGRF